jgi:hypothetical protein
MATIAVAPAIKSSSPELVAPRWHTVLRLLWADNLAKAAPPVLPPELELRSPRRTQNLLGWQR